MNLDLIAEIRRRTRTESQHTVARALSIQQKQVWQVVHLGDDGLCHKCKSEPVFIQKFALGRRCYFRRWRLQQTVSSRYVHRSRNRRRVNA